MPPFSSCVFLFLIVVVVVVVVVVDVDVDVDVDAPTEGPPRLTPILTRYNRNTRVTNAF